MSRNLLISLLLVLLAACALPAAGEPTPEPTAGTGYTLEWLAGLPADAVLLQLEIEPTFSRPESTYVFGRIPPFTLYADGRVVYLDEGDSFDQQEVLAARLSPEEALALVQEVMDAGYEGLESYTDMCMTQADGSEMCIADAAFTVLRALLSTGERREIRSYAGFSNDPATLEEIILALQGFDREDATPYRPDRAALFIRRVSDTLDGFPPQWPLVPDYLQGTESAERVVVLSGEELQRLIDAAGRNIGDAFFRHQEDTYAVYIVPWLPHVDYSEEIMQNFPPPTPAPVPEPLMELAENAAWNLSGLLGVPREAVVVTAIEQVDWPNGCLGIDYLDMACTEAIVPGYRLILSAGGQTYEYRSNLDGSLLLLADPVGPPPGESPDAILILEPGPGSRVVSPLVVLGEANPAFEQTLMVEIVLEDGSILAAAPARIQADVGLRGGFELELPFEVQEERAAFVTVYATSARDGGVTHLSTVGVRLASDGQADIQPAAGQEERIRIDSPMPGEMLTSGVVRVTGFGLASFEGTLIVEVWGDGGVLLASEPLLVRSPDIGLPGPFEVELVIDVATPGPGRVVVRDPSPAHPGDLHLASVEVMLSP